MNDTLYDILNKIQRWLPCIGVLYLALCNIWGLPFGNEVSETLVAVATCLASILEISTVIYKQKHKEIEQ